MQVKVGCAYGVYRIEKAFGTMKATIKKMYGAYLVMLCLGVFASNGMHYDQEDLKEFLAPWVLKKDEAISFMQQSVDFQSPKKIVEFNCLKAIFDARDTRVTLYEALNCCSLTFDYFLFCIEMYTNTHEDSHGKNNKKCSVQ